MADTAIRALALWEHLADTRVRAPLTVAVSPNSRMCPPGWCGIVHLDGTTLATAPTEELADALHRSLASVEPAAHTEPEALTPLLPIGDSLGPATLAYLSPPDFRSVAAPPDQPNSPSATPTCTRSWKPSAPRTRGRAAWARSPHRPTPSTTKPLPAGRPESSPRPGTGTGPPTPLTCAC
ncbi:hypothetical protein [Nocardiopsis oceani]